MSQYNKVSMNIIKKVLTFRKLLKKIYSVGEGFKKKRVTEFSGIFRGGGTLGSSA